VGADGFGKKFPCEKRSVRLHCRDATTSYFGTKVWGEPFTHFHAVAVKVTVVCGIGPPLWSSDQSSWLQIRRPGFDSRHYQKKVVGLERGPLSLVSTTEELLYRKVAAPV
jgi:hypothetical protein